MREIYSEALAHRLRLADSPRRTVSLVSSATEALDWMGLLDRVVGVSGYCSRYVEDLHTPVVGQYLSCDVEKLKALEPDLVLVTGGVQLELGRKLARQDLPVYALPLPTSFPGILEAITILGGLVNEIEKAEQLIDALQARSATLRAERPATPPSVYVELWLGRHMRAVGGLSFIRDLVDLAGGRMLFGNRAEAYFTPDLAAVGSLRPDVHVFFHEPEFQIDGAALVHERNWDSEAGLVTSTVEKGRNLIQDGPSLLDTAEWLRDEMRKATSP
jgi:ABC-type Fe3+-hydroxamate transport system substrate-binding protein